MPMVANAEATPLTCEGPGLLMGTWILVDRYMINLPCTIKLSLDRFRSKVSISEDEDHKHNGILNGRIINGMMKETRTMTT